MKEITVKITGSGTQEDRYRVNLPTYKIIDMDIGKRQAKILVPDDEVDEVVGNDKNKKLMLSKDKIRQKYRGQKWDRSDVCDDVIIL